MVGWVGEIKIKDHLSPAEAEIRAELGNMSFYLAFVQISKDTSFMDAVVNLTCFYEGIHFHSYPNIFFAIKV